jgi:magnesium chelatase accessory protein
MAQWDLTPLIDALPGLATPTLFLAGENDRTVKPAVSIDAARIMPHASVQIMPGVGHLAHEEEPAETAIRIEAFRASVASTAATAQ